MDILDWMQGIAFQFGYLGVFLVSLLGTMAIIIPLPYTLVILGLGAAGWDPIKLTIAAGFGAALGEFAGYLLGYYGRRVISEERQRRMDYLLKILGKYSPIAIFVFALTPLPDDLLFIPLGMLRYSPIKAFIPAVSGKLLMSFILASFGRVYWEFLTFVFGDSGGLISTVITGTLLVLAIWLLYRVDWERVFEKYFVRRHPVQEGSPKT